MFIGQYETTLSQFSYTTKMWQHPDDPAPLRPKSDGHTRMISVFVSRIFGMGMHVTQQQLHDICQNVKG